MDLILWRHAEAEAEREGLADLDRALTSKGERQAQRMGEWLNQRIAHSTRILVSPALRCQQTAQALSRSFKTMAALAPDATVEAVLKAARWPHSAEPVLVVGHQPTLGRRIAYSERGEFIQRSIGYYLALCTSSSTSGPPRSHAATSSFSKCSVRGWLCAQSDGTVSVA